MSEPEHRAALNAWIRALQAVKSLDETPGATLPSLLDGFAVLRGDGPALLGEGDRLSYRELSERVNRIARWAVAHSLVAGDVVCLLMPNCPDYVAIWLGLTRAGCVVALINTNLVADGLAHSIRTAGSTKLIVGGALLPALAAVADRLEPETSIWVHGDTQVGHTRLGDWPVFEPYAERYGTNPLSAAERAFPAPADLALLIFTSGTTGAPKAARITHARVLEWSFWFAGMMEAQPADRLYDCLPLYHSTGGIVAVGAMLVAGGSVLIRAHFSASRFWDDVADDDCTIFQYVGELCRYLADSPPHPRERLHRLRLACGNGLRGDVWTNFVQRFAVAQVLEFYAATEGSVSLYNCEGKPGAIGRVPPFLAHRFPVRLISCDAETGMPRRDAAGLCIACGPGEVGEAIGEVGDAARPPARHFDGYTDAAASARKLLHDVFAAGDCWFRTGDLMRTDAAGYFYFIDRLGDTFRWKGENVATTEVATVLRGFPGVTDAVVYGVIVPRHEGRAGMAAVTVNERFEIADLSEHLRTQLPGYAQPLFLRLCARLDLTGTFKLATARLMQEGFAQSSDPVWFNHREAGRFVPCDPGLLRSIANGTQRL